MSGKFYNTTIGLTKEHLKFFEDNPTLNRSAFVRQATDRQIDEHRELNERKEGI